MKIIVEGADSTDTESSLSVTGLSAVDSTSNSTENSNTYDFTQLDVSESNEEERRKSGGGGGGRTSGGARYNSASRRAGGGGYYGWNYGLNLSLNWDDNCPSETGMEA
ncbi:hypothetical protein F444_03912 [Phytophthora nicotianae P1976]|uniref:Uncharacterized protein n=1 Tax=Phytophthora nicotianae P1976 TaxID=1317066 RepID=A0A081ASI1_PHYNI|nr:hypothetical protein F444_03912 [Phytophthora nicotianae P1976]